MTFKGYEVETLGSDDDCGVMPDNVDTLKEAVVGHKIVNVGIEKGDDDWSCYGHKAVVLTLDNGKKVKLSGSDDCCAFTDAEALILDITKIDHIITGVGTPNGYDTWHIYCDLGDVLQLQVAWSCGNPFYYGYGFTITVEDVDG